MDQILNWTLTTIIILIAIYICYALIYNNCATNYIDEFWNHYQNSIKKYGLKLERIKFTDCSPCEVRFRLLNNQDIRAEFSSRKTLKILKNLKKGKLKKEYLISKSEWPVCNLPS